MFSRILLFLFALPVALAATAGLADAGVAIPMVFTSLHPPQIKIDDPRGEKAVDEPPSVEVADEDQPKFPGFTPSSPDESPCARISPAYPTQCMASARPRETVLVEFDVAPDGGVTNVRVVHTTNMCLNQAAATAVSSWRCEPKLDADGAPRWRKGVLTAITFQLTE